jgi:hypothetical protein
LVQVWSRNRKVLDEFVQEARKFYMTSPQPPPKQDYDWVCLAVFFFGIMSFTDCGAVAIADRGSLQPGYAFLFAL